MAARSDTFIALEGIDFSTGSANEIKVVYTDTLRAGLHGFRFSPCAKGQFPGSVIPGEQIECKHYRNGQPNKCTVVGGVATAYENAVKYYINTGSWATENNIEMFYFSALDEAWKVSDEGDTVAYRGIFDKNKKN